MRGLASQALRVISNLSGGNQNADTEISSCPSAGGGPGQVVVGRTVQPMWTQALEGGATHHISYDGSCPHVSLPCQSAPVCTPLMRWMLGLDAMPAVLRLTRLPGSVSCRHRIPTRPPFKSGRVALHSYMIGQVNCFLIPNRRAKYSESLYVNSCRDITRCIGFLKQTYRHTAFSENMFPMSLCCPQAARLTGAV